MATCKRAHPVKFSQAVFDRICDRMSEGESLRAICKTVGMPNKRTVMRWVEADQKLQIQYSAAQQLRAEHYFDEIVDIADSKSDPQKTRVQIDARKWVLARMNPKKYGDKFTQELTGEGGGALVVELVRFRGDDADDSVA